MDNFTPLLQIIRPGFPPSRFMSINHVNLSERMRLVWLEHIFWTRLLLISIADNLGDLNFTEARLLENPKDIADIFRRFYGNRVATIIEDLLTEHLKIGGELIVALKNNNSNLAEELNKKWYKNADDIAEALSSINPFFKKEDVRQMMYEHLKLTSDEVAARLKEDYSLDIKSYELVQNEILKMATYFTNGIVMQFPRLFSY